ncbi:hypothetical protein, partial [Anaerotignum sp.]|uniref:hypothetical protein n=1 Tax=Anaerotignum sp. TaxID=2039241 RepID=UPI002ED500E0
TGVLCVAMTASGLFLGCAEAKETNITLSQQQEEEVVALLGDLNENVSDGVKDELRKLVYEAETSITERELKDNYRLSNEEAKVWEEITNLLDKETMRQFGRVYGYANGVSQGENQEENIDYGKEMMDNLKKILSNQDWNRVNEIRNDYFTAIENNDQDYNTDPELEIRLIINKYSELDADAILLNLLGDKSQKNLGMFKITPEFDAVYQNGTENGLNLLGSEEQESLKKVWEQTTDILPKELFANFKYFKVGGDGELGVFAYVTPLDSEGKIWCMSVDPADIKDDGFYPYTVVHEMAHYITLNQNQVKYLNSELYPMDRYREWLFVANEDSYLQAYYKLFWRDMIIDWYTNRDNPYFYLRHQSQFVTGYASTNCTEDMAESFSAYVLLDEAPTPETQAKLDFFDSYPELKDIKSDILNNIKKNNVYVNPSNEPVYEQEENSTLLDGYISLLSSITEIMS